MFKSNRYIGAIAGVTALAAVAFVMLSNSSPYVSIAEAKTMDANNLHIQGDLLKETVKVDINTATIQFRMIDENGDEVNVLHHGLPPANMGEATTVVAVGGMRGDRFESTKLLTKCPSKYETEDESKVASN